MTSTNNTHGYLITCTTCNCQPKLREGDAFWVCLETTLNWWWWWLMSCYCWLVVVAGGWGCGAMTVFLPGREAYENLLQCELSAKISGDYEALHLHIMTLLKVKMIPVYLPSFGIKLAASQACRDTAPDDDDDGSFPAGTLPSTGQHQ